MDILNQRITTVAKNPFRAYLSDAAKKQLEVIRQHEQDKIGLGPDGQPVRLSDTWMAEEFIKVRHEALTAGRSNRERIADIVAAVTTMDEKIDRLITFLMEERNHVRPDDN